MYIHTQLEQERLVVEAEEKARTDAKKKLATVEVKRQGEGVVCMYVYIYVCMYCELYCRMHDVLSVVCMYGI